MHIERISRLLPAFATLLLMACGGGGSSGPSSVSDTPPAASAPPAPGNSAPVIRGSPRTEIVRGEFYAFAPVVADSDGDILRFSIRNRPSWANFDEATGRLDGTPGVDDLGRHEGIRITVTDGVSAADLPGFTIEVLDNGRYSVTLSWDAPVQRTDGTPLTRLGGYYLYFGPALLDRQVVIDNPGITTWTLTDLAAGTWQVALSAFDEDGRESKLSNVVEISLGRIG
jgi:hypothetical protein